MINLTFDITTKLARFVQPAVIKFGADVPIILTFSAAPGDVTGISLALGSDTAAPEVLAFTEDFAEESATVWTAVLDASDTRLADFLRGKATVTVKAELATIIDGIREVAPNLDVTVQQRIVSGPEGSEGGPTYYTRAQLDAMIVRFVSGLSGYTGGGATNLDGLVTVAASYNVVQFVHATDGLRSYQLVAGTDAEATPGIIRPDDYHAGTNARVWKSV